MMSRILNQVFNDIDKVFPFFFIGVLLMFIGCDSVKKERISKETAIEETPEVQVLIPGFSVKELPVSLSNINVVRYGPDGLLYALAYDGHIYRLTDTDGDDIEDKVEVWWDKNLLVSPIGMVVTEDGIYTTSKNKVSVIRDTDNDGKGDAEEVITSDWVTPSRYTGTSSGGVDAMGIARDKSGNIFFALGTANFTNAYQIDSLGKSHYDLNNQRGTILKVTPASRKREIFATGTRFPVAMAFNKHGDLFATEQEGATWLPNGNPYDELLHIQEGRHYGFPPRHPVHLPNVIDEPSTFDYKPQHQSTTGLNFNTPGEHGVVFGPAFWEDDAFVTGYSRGKIYRTKLVKTPAGYVAQNQIFASLSPLTVDACTSPTGAMVVATHTGFPDWGYGPNAKGKLYKIFYTNKEVPIPVSVWASQPDQVRVAFDRPLNKDYLVNLVENIKIESGIYVQAGDRFEVLRPGYKAVERQQNFPREKLKVKTVELSNDRQTLILNTFTHDAPVNYGLTLPGFSDDKKLKNTIGQVPAIDLSYSLNGVNVTWQSSNGNEQWQGWLPHLDLKVNRTFMAPVGEFRGLKKLLQKPGKITLRTKVDLYNMLRPDTQPASTLDYQLPPENVTLVFRSSAPLAVNSSLPGALVSKGKDGFYETKITINEVKEQGYDLEISMHTTAQEPLLSVHYFTNEDSRPRPLQLHRFFLPWVKDIVYEEIMPVAENPELAGGNWARGKKIFFNEGACSTCHSIKGEGKDIGPDLSNLVYRDYASVYRDITQPSAAIEPDYLAHKVTLNNSDQLVGMVSYKKDSMVIRDIIGHKTAVSMEAVKETTPLSRSLMPPGLDKALGEQKMKDLMTYLLTSLKPAVYKRQFGVGQIRKASEVEEVLKDVEIHGKDKADEKINILWVSGPKDHGRDEHDYPLQQKRWTELFSLANNVEVNNVSAWPTEQQFKNSDVIVFFWNNPKFTEQNGKQIDAYLKRGGGLVYLHYAVDATANPKALADRIGLAWKRKHAKFRHGEVELHFSDSKHSITKGFDHSITFRDESYWNLIKGTQKINVLATATEAGKPRPMLWTTTEGKGRIFVSLLGHYNWTFDDPLFRILLLRGIAWTGHQPADRFIDLATMGARMSD